MQLLTMGLAGAHRARPTHARMPASTAPAATASRGVARTATMVTALLCAHAVLPRGARAQAPEAAPVPVRTVVTTIASDPTPLPPLSRRLTDADMSRDHATLDSLVRAARGNARALAYLALAREAYERNDDGALTALLVAASSARARVPRATLPALWALADSARGTPEAARRALPLEAALVRAQYPLLGAPSCAAWAEEAARLADPVRRALVPPAVVAQSPVTVAPPPAAAPEPRVLVPRELRGIPSRVHFALDRHILSPASQRVLDVLVDSLRRFPEVRIVLEGHTDPRASAAYNDALSRRRAISVRSYLLARGIDATRLTIVARGKSQLETEAFDVRSLARNRRVQLRYYAPDGSEIPALQLLDDLQLEGTRPVVPRRARAPR
ncbi:MAG: OmpA family protein [Gemmatimonadaceae bacterium]|nr:OmpA family protein [Gemmatimonadaceae bacterium]